MCPDWGFGFGVQRMHPMVVLMYVLWIACCTMRFGAFESEVSGLLGTPVVLRVVLCGPW